MYARWCSTSGLCFQSPSDRQVERYLVYQLTRYSRSTAVNRLMAIRSFYRYLRDRGSLAGDPTKGIEIRRERLEPRRPYTHGELRALVDACLTIRDRALVLMLIGSGARRSEIVKMRSEDVDWQRGRILIRGKGNRRRWVAPGVAAMEALVEYVGRRRGTIWLSHDTQPMTGQRVYLIICRLAARAGVVNAHPHRFRVTFANAFVKRFGNLAALKEIMGHSDITTTEHYASWDIANRALDMQERFDFGGEFSREPPAAAAG